MESTEDEQMFSDDSYGDQDYVPPSDFEDEGDLLFIPKVDKLKSNYIHDHMYVTKSIRSTTGLNGWWPSW